MKPTNCFRYSAILLSVCFSISGVAAPPDKNAPSEVIVINDGTIPIPVTANAYRFVGFSTDTVFGDAGLAAMHLTCQGSFGSGARMCTTKEIFETTDIPPNTGLSGWVQPTCIGQNTPSLSTNIFDTFSGIGTSSGGGLTCQGWTNLFPDVRGFTVDGEFKFSILSCDVSRNIACCAP